MATIMRGKPIDTDLIIIRLKTTSEVLKSTFPSVSRDCYFAAIELERLRKIEAQHRPEIPVYIPTK